MPITLGKSLAALRAQRALGQNTAALASTFERLSSGLRINRASDDAAGLSASMKMGNDARVYSQAIRNANDAISALSIADGALTQFGDILGRLKELASQAANGTLSRVQRVALDKEGAALSQEFNRIVGSTRFNGLSLMNIHNESLRIQVGYGIEGGIDIDLNDALSRSIGNGFQSGSSFVANANSITAATLADIDGDGTRDLITTSSVGGRVAVARGRGDGTFEAHTEYLVNTANALQVADLESDGDLDIVVGNGTTGLHVLLNDGTGTFSATEYALTSSTNTNIAIGDINGDGFLDIAAASNNANIRLIYGVGDGTFGGETTFVAGGSLFAYSLNLIDTNEDGNLDIVYSNNTNSTIDVALGDGIGGFGSASAVASSISGGRIVTGDFNFDGLLDLGVSSTSAFTTLLADGVGSFSQSQSFADGTSASVTIGDVDGDGISDVIRRKDNTSVYFYKGHEDGTFDDATTYSLAGGAALALGDLNGDGLPDLVSSSTTAGQAISYLVDGTASSTIQRFNLTTQSEARSALEAIEEALNRVLSERGNIGASMSRITSALSVLGAMRNNNEAAKSKITDIDVATETANLTRQQILQDTSSAILAQANQDSALVLALLDFN